MTCALVIYLSGERQARRPVERNVELYVDRQPTEISRDFRPKMRAVGWKVNRVLPPLARIACDVSYEVGNTSEDERLSYN